jgi:hypothetical protein
MNGGWEEGYGEGGVQDGANIVFHVTKERSLVTFTYDSYNHLLHISEDLREVESASTSCQSTQDCKDRLGSDWECDSGLCVQIEIKDDDSSATCVFTSLLGKNNPALDSVKRFRDEILRKYILGRKVIYLYYQHQGEIFSLLDNNPLLRQVTKKYVESLAAFIGVFLEEGTR